MTTSDLFYSRRRLLKTACAVGGAAWLRGAGLLAGEAPAKRPKVAALFTEFRQRSHAYNILENFFEPYLFNGQLVDPGCQIVSFYADQFPTDDLARDVSKRFDVPLFSSIDAALCRGGKQLDVDAVLLIAEHGDYPYNELGQHLYPRKQFFDQAVATLRRSGRFVPLFNDKHLSYRWDWAAEMFATANQNQMGMLAGSSVPLAERRPALDLPRECQIESAVVVHGGGMEVYGFHGLELLQSFVESRHGGETGIRRIELVHGDRLKQAYESGRIRRELVDAAMAAEKNMHALRRPRPASTRTQAAAQPQIHAQPNQPPTIEHAILVDYRDGLQAAVLTQGSDSNRWNFACRVRGESQPRATAMFNGPWGNRCLFKALSHAIQSMFTTGRPPYSLRRTLLTTGAIETAMRSYTSGKPLDTPELKLAYGAGDWSAFREQGASWKLITADTPEPEGFSPGDARLLNR